MTIKARRLRAAGLLALTCLVGACSSAPPSPTLVDLTVTATLDVNPDTTGRPSPVIVRYYQLGATAAFETADYFQLHDKEAAVLGQNLLDRQELPVMPGTSTKITITAKPGTTAIGVVAAYRDIDRAQWRTQAPVAAGKTTKIDVQVGKSAVAVKPDAK